MLLAYSFVYGLGSAVFFALAHRVIRAAVHDRINSADVLRHTAVAGSVVLQAHR